MKTTRVLLYASACVLALLWSGCGPTYRSEVINSAHAKGWTEEQSLAVFAYLDRLDFLEKNSKDEYAVKRSKLKTADVRKKLEDFLGSADQILDYKNEDSARYLDVFKLRADIEHQEKVLQAVFARVRAVELNDEFELLMGTGVSLEGVSHMGGYDAKRIFLAKDIISAFPFTSDFIDDARQKGLLKQIEHGIWVFERTFDRKEADPAKLDDSNAFVWKNREEAIELTSYKILDVPKPQDNASNYIEGYRIVDGKRESRPAIKVFFPRPGAGVILLDVDREGKDPGFGIPDFLERTSITSIGDILQSRSLIERLFAEKAEQKRIPPVVKSVVVEIVKVGQPPDMWEQSSDPRGWMVPFKYRNELKSNYNVKIKLARSLYEQDIKLLNIATSIEYIAREWTGTDRYTPSLGTVIEYFKPKALFDQKNVLKAEVYHLENTKKVVVDFEDGNEVTGIVTPGTNKFVEDEPFAIDFTEGQKRWHLEKDAGSNIFNKRKEISFPKNATGVY